MKTIHQWLLAAAATLGSAAAPAQSGAPIDNLAWLAGCWSGGSGERRFDEQWMAPRANTMLGMGRTLQGGALGSYEFMAIRDEGGGLVFIAQPSGQKQASFLAVSLSETGIVFENRAHDFPQRVSYQRQADGSLLARIEGVSKGQARAVDFPMRRVACPG